MAVKSVIDVEVNDEAFKDFSKLFEKYREALGQTPGVWASAEKATAGTAMNVENLVAGLLTHEAINRKIAREEAEKTRQLEKQQRIMRGFAPTFRDVAKSVSNITASIFKWSSIGTLTGGLLGYGGLLGLDRLANGVGAGRRSSQGIGATYGEEKSFENTYSRLVDPKAFLSGVSEAMTDVTKRAALFGAGMTGKEFEGKSTGAVANDLIPLLKRIVDKTPEAQLAQVLTARRLDQFISLEDARRLKRTSPAELAEFRGSYARGVNELGLSDATAKKWQDLGVQLDRAKGKIETVLVNALSPLAKPLASLSDSIANALKNFLTGIDPKTIKDIGEGIEDFGKYLGSPEFRTDVKNFANDVSYAAKKIASALRWLGILPDNSPEAVESRDRVKALVDSGKPYSLADYQAAKFGKVDTNRPAKWYDPGSWMSHNGGIGSLLDKMSINDRVLDAVEWKESRGNAKAVGPQTKYGRAQGAYQLMPGTAKQYGVKNPFDKAESREGARRYLVDLTRKYSGDVTKALAAYNWGPGNLDRALKKHGAAWRSHLPAETSDYVEKITARIIGRERPNERKSVVAAARAAAPKVTHSEKVVVRDRERVTKHVGTSSAPAARKADAPAARPAPASPAKSARVQVGFTINNNTGGSAVVQQSQVAKQG